MFFVGQILIQALSLGSLYTLLAIGFSLVFGATRVLNLAHGSFVIFSGYVAYILGKYYNVGFILASWLSILAPLIFLPVIVFISSRSPHPRETISLILTFGLSLVLQSCYMAAFSADYRILYETPSFYEIPALRVIISSNQLILISISLSAIALLFLLFRKTMIGKALRATIQNNEAALLVGIPIRQMRILAVGLGCLAAGLAGALYVRINYIYPAGDMEVTLIALLITLFAGRGRIRRILICAWSFALIETIVSYWWGAKWRDLLSSLFIIAVLLKRGEEIFENSREK
ncbi:MAG: branched-chain amino acid ABC transporter permease [Thermodesulforhabdaceae bacterium]